MKRDNTLYLDDIQEAINNIGVFTKDISKPNFLKNKLVQSAVIRQIEIIGEATKNVPTTFRNKYPNIEWKKIAGMRDVIIHAYFQVNLELVWKVIKDDLPKLKKQIETIK